MNAPYDDSWIEKDFLELDKENEQNMGLAGNTGGTTRWEQLLPYFLEVNGTGIR